MKSSIAKLVCLIDEETEFSKGSLLSVYTQSCTGQKEADEALAFCSTWVLFKKNIGKIFGELWQFFLNLQTKCVA